VGTCIGRLAVRPVRPRDTGSRIQVMTYDQLISNAANALQILFAETDEEQDDDGQDDDGQDDEGEYETDDDSWAGYDGPGHDESDDEPPF
jgi:hypothetical protein